MKYKLLEIANVAAGQGAPQGDHNYCDYGTPFVKAGNLAELIAGADIESIQKVNESVVKSHKLKLYKKGSVLFAKSGMSCLKGYVYVLPSDAYVVSHLACIMPEKINSDYLRYYFLFHKPNSLVKDEAYPSISLTDIANMDVQVPEKDAVRNIITTLAKVESLIALYQLLLLKLNELVKARFAEMFGNPATNEMCWEVVPLSACLKSIDNGKSFVCNSSTRQGEWPAMLKLSAATSGCYRPEENKAMLNESQFIEDTSVRVGDLLFTRKNTPELVGMCAYVYATPKNLMMPDLIFRLNTTDRCNKIFLWKLINHDLFRDRIQAIATGSAKSMSSISKKRLLNLEIILPPLEQQTQFAAFVAQFDKTKDAVQQALDKTQQLFDSLMQEYFG